MDLPAPPAKHAALVEAETRCRAIRGQRLEVEAKLRQVETAQACANIDLDEVAERIADGTIAELSISELPAAQADLQKQVDVLAHASRKAHEKLTHERERYNREIVRAFRPAHRAAVQQIARAVEALVAANAAELAVRAACPVALVSLQFPHVGDFTCNNPRIAKFWRDNAKRLSFLDKPKPPVKAKRGRFAGRGKANGGAGEEAPLAVKGAE
jgi:hypothetical protein